VKLRGFVPETNALSVLSYGRIVKIKDLRILGIAQIGQLCLKLRPEMSPGTWRLRQEPRN